MSHVILPSHMVHVQESSEAVRDPTGMESGEPFSLYIVVEMFFIFC